MAADDPEEGLEAELSATEEKPADTMQCPVCRETIKAGARKCVECNSDLDWKRYFTLSNTTLALLTALVSVVGSSYPGIKKMMTPEVSSISVHLAGLNYEDTRLSLLATNLGSQTGVIDNLALTFQLPNDITVNVQLRIPGDGIIFVPGQKTIPVTINLDDLAAVHIRGANSVLLQRTPANNMSQSEIENYYLLTSGVNSDGERYDKDYTFNWFEGGRFYNKLIENLYRDPSTRPITLPGYGMTKQQTPPGSKGP